MPEPRQQRVDPGEIGARTELLEHARGRPRARARRRRRRRAPRTRARRARACAPPRTAPRALATPAGWRSAVRAAEVSLEPERRPRGVRRHRAERVASLDVRDDRELVACALGLLDLAGSERDLDVRRAGAPRARAAPPVSPTTRRIAASAASPLPCASRSSASPGCGSPPCRLRVAIGLLRSLEVPAQAVQLALDVERLPRRLADSAPPARARRPSGLLQRGLPGTQQLHDLGAMHEAHALVGDHVGLPLAPEGKRRGPLAGAPQLVRALTDRDRVAVEDPGDDRRELPVVTATMLSSTRRRPSSVRPSSRSAWPCSITPIATRSRSPKRSPISTASAATARAASKSRSAKCRSIARGGDSRARRSPDRRDRAAAPRVRTSRSRAHPRREQQVEADPPGAARGARRGRPRPGGSSGRARARAGSRRPGRACTPTCQSSRSSGSSGPRRRPRQRLEGVAPCVLRARRPAALELHRRRLRGGRPPARILRPSGRCCSLSGVPFRPRRRRNRARRSTSRARRASRGGSGSTPAARARRRRAPTRRTSPVGALDDQGRKAIASSPSFAQTVSRARCRFARCRERK